MYKFLFAILLSSMAVSATTAFGQSLRITAPQPGTDLTVGAALRIEWEAQPAARVSLWYSVDDRASWILLAPGLSDTFYDWIVPETPNDAIEFRVTLQRGTDPRPILEVLDAHSAEIRFIQIASDGRRMLSASRDGDVQLRSTADGSLIARSSIRLDGGAPAIIYQARFLHGSEEVLATQGADIVHWNVLSGSATPLGLQGHTDFIRAVAVHPTRRVIATGGNDKAVRVWDLDRGVLLRSYTRDLTRIYSLEFAPDGASLAFAGEDGRIHIRRWESENDDQPAAVQLASHGRITEQSDGTRDTSLRLIWNISYSDDGRHIASGGVDRSVRAWQANSSQQAADFIAQGHNSAVWSVDFASDGRRLLSGSLDRTLRQWDASSGAEIEPAIDHGGQVLSVTYSPTADTIASTGRDLAIRLWHSGADSDAEDLAFYDVFKPIVIEVPHLTERIGRIIRIPVLLRKADELDIAADLRLDLTLETPATLLFLRPDASMASGRFTNTLDTIRIPVALDPNRDTLAVVTALVLHGEPGTQPISIRSVEWRTPANLVAINDDGSISIEGDCGDPADLRLGIAGPTVGIQTLAPNPVKDLLFVEYILPIDGWLRTDITTLRGDVVRQLFAGPASAGFSDRFIDVRDLAAGEYFLRLSLARYSFTRKFIVLD